MVCTRMPHCLDRDLAHSGAGTLLVHLSFAEEAELFEQRFVRRVHTFCASCNPQCQPECRDNWIPH